MAIHKNNSGNMLIDIFYQSKRTEFIENVNDWIKNCKNYEIFSSLKVLSYAVLQC